VSGGANLERGGVHDWIAGRGAWTRRALALLCGALATVAHAPFQFTLVYALSIVGLVWLLDAASAAPQRRIGRAFALGWCFGFGHVATGMYWLSAAFLVDSDAWGPIWGVPAVFAMAAGLALFWGAGCALAMAMWTTDWRRLAALAFALAISEWMRGHLFGGLPWLLPAYVWTPGEPVSQLAALVGAYGLSAVTLLVAASPASIFDRESGGGGRFAPLLVAALCMGLVWGWGARRLDTARVALPGATPIVRVADAGLSQAEKWTYQRDQEWRVLADYIAVSGAPDQSPASVVIWPESAIPTLNFFTLENQEFLDAIGEALGDRVLILGVTRCEPLPECGAYMRGERNSDGLHFYNSAAIIDGVSGRPRLSQVYDKHRLVPFGEFIPLWSLISQLNIAPLQRIGAGFESGAPPSRLVVPEAPPAVVFICYEAIFPGLAPRGEGRAGWIVSVTNDAWFGRGSGPWQHFAMARYRAIEEGLPMARAASGGISAIVDAYGRTVRAVTEPGAGAAEAQLPPALTETAYAKWGLLLTAALVLLIGAIRIAPARVRARGIDS
jgi:apolipoprotein N-acyltransferase